MTCCGKLNQAFNIFDYLKCHPDSKLAMNPEGMYLEERFKSCLRTMHNGSSSMAKFRRKFLFILLYLMVSDQILAFGQPGRKRSRLNVILKIMILFCTFCSYSCSNSFHSMCRDTYAYVAIATEYVTLGGQAASIKLVPAVKPLLQNVTLSILPKFNLWLYAPVGSEKAPWHNRGKYFTGVKTSPIYTSLNVCHWPFQSNQYPVYTPYPR